MSGISRNVRSTRVPELGGVVSVRFECCPVGKPWLVCRRREGLRSMTSNGGTSLRGNQFL